MYTNTNIKFEITFILNIEAKDKMFQTNLTIQTITDIPGGW